MHFRIQKLAPILSAAISVASCKSLTSQRDKASPEWMESLNDFKSLVHAVTFGDEIPSHHSNPLQLLVAGPQEQFLFELPNGWFGKGRKKPIGKKSIPSLKKSNKKPKFNGGKSRKMQSMMSSSMLHQNQDNDELALLNFLVQLEEPKNRLHVQSAKSKKQLESLIMAENRYKEIKKKLNTHATKAMKSKRGSDKPLIETDPYKMKSAKKIKKSHFSGNDGKSKKDKKKWYENIDAKGARNTLTLSVAFGVIVTALFCVVVQLFKLFAKPKNGAFEQINRRSTYGYDRIALDIEDDEESAPLAA